MPAAIAADAFATLNVDQRAAVEHGLESPACGPLLVVAGAGSGKTLTLASRVARLVLAGADPQRLLLLTFSRRAAQEMARRAGRVLHQAMRLRATQRAPQLPWSGTFHGVGARLLREYAPRIGLAENFSIHDRGDCEDLMALVRQSLGFDRSKNRFPLKGTCLAIYSRALNSQAPLREVLLQHYPWCGQWEAELKQLFRVYVAEKQSQQVLDYDDLLLHWAQAMADAQLAAHIGARFDHVLVDEYQDTNRLQAAILLGMKPGGAGLTVVGDDAQSIYSFRAAEVRNILDFPSRFEPPARVVTLARNYRSTQPILDASNAVIALACERFSKTLWTDRAAAERPKLVAVEDDMAQARWVADEVLRQREQGLTLKSQAVLFRSSHHSTGLELELTRRNIPFVKFGGLEFLEAAHVKDVLAVLRFAHNPRNRTAGFRVVQLVPGIGPASARKLLDAMQASADPATALRDFQPPPGARASWPAFAALFEVLHAGQAAWPADIDHALRWLEPLLPLRYDDHALRAGDLAQLARIAGGYTSRERFLTELTLDPPVATSDEAGVPLKDEDYLILSTIHSAKGQEWRSVTLLNAVDGCIPSDLATGSAAEIEEERRLLYVAMTRAKQHLQLMVPQRFYVTQQGGFGDRHVYGQRTRFIPPELVALFESIGPVAETGRPAGAHVPAVNVDVQAAARSLWA